MINRYFKCKDCRHYKEIGGLNYCDSKTTNKSITYGSWLNFKCLDLPWRIKLRNFCTKIKMRWWNFQDTYSLGDIILIIAMSFLATLTLVLVIALIFSLLGVE